MKKQLLFLLLFSLGLNAQQTISGNFTPAKDFTWLVAYHLKPGTQNYIADTAVTDGKFTLNIPENKPTGIYRLVYAVPQEEFYFDVIYNGKEDIVLNFNATKGVTFTTSTENIPYSTYFKDINATERSLIEFYTSGNTNVKKYDALLSRLASAQKTGEKQTEGLLANDLIKANRPYIPTQYQPLSDYVNAKKKHYFDALDISNTTLQASGMLTDKLMNYVFTALPLAQINALATEKFMQENVQTIAKKLEGVDDKYRFSVFYTLWSQAAASKLNRVSDFTYQEYLKELAVTTENTQTILDIETHNRLRLGAVAPELNWKANDSMQKLSTWEGGEKYVLVFWSSTCSHCLKELPALHKELKNNEKVKVLAIGLEDSETNWLIEANNLPNFDHAISIGKWDSEYAHLYNVLATPSYYILDADKKIIAKPDSDKAVVDFFDNN